MDSDVQNESAEVLLPWKLLEDYSYNGNLELNNIFERNVDKKSFNFDTWLAMFTEIVVDEDRSMVFVKLWNMIRHLPPTRGKSGAGMVTNLFLEIIRQYELPVIV